MLKISNSPDHEYNPEGLTVGALIERLKTMSPDHKIWLETSDVDPEGEGTLIGQIVEVQDGRDGAAYLRIDADQEEVQDSVDPH